MKFKRMKRFVRLNFFLCLLIGVFSCKSANKPAISPEPNTVDGSKKSTIDYEISLEEMSFRVRRHRYVLSGNRFEKYLIGNKEDSLIFAHKMAIDEELKTLVSKDYTALKSKYHNPCMADGTQFKVKFKNKGGVKEVLVSNYYLQEVADVINLINSKLSEKDQLWYNKEALDKHMEDCKDAQKVKDAE